MLSLLSIGPFSVDRTPGAGWMRNRLWVMLDQLCQALSHGFVGSESAWGGQVRRVPSLEGGCIGTEPPDQQLQPEAHLFMRNAKRSSGPDKRTLPVWTKHTEIGLRGLTWNEGLWKGCPIRAPRQWFPIAPSPYSGPTCLPRVKPQLLSLAHLPFLFTQWVQSVPLDCH